MLPELESERLLLRPRRLDDLDAIARMNADPQVMRHIASIDDPAMGRDAVAARSFTHVARGLGYWSVFAKIDPADFTGYVGLIPDGDAVLMHKLMIEGNEEEYLRIANRFEPTLYGFIAIRPRGRG